MLSDNLIIKVAQYLPIEEQINIFKLSKSLYENSTNIRLQYQTWLNEHKNGKYKFNNTKFIRYLIIRGFDRWNWGLYMTCIGGNVECVQLMINMGATMWNWGLWGACRGGNIQCVRLMIKMGASNWNRGLHGACRGGNVPCVQLMVEMGATKCDWCRESINMHIKN